MTDAKCSKKLFLWLLIPQLVLCVAYWIFGINTMGGETFFQRSVLVFYKPVAYAVMIPGAAFGWAGVGFMLAFTPLIGAFIYAYLFARLAKSTNNFGMADKFTPKNDG